MVLLYPGSYSLYPSIKTVYMKPILLNKSFCLLIFSVLLAAFTSPSIAQNSKQEKKKQKAMQIKAAIIDSQHFVFMAESAIPQSGEIRNLTSEYSFTVTKDSIFSLLPYYGRAFSSIDYGSSKSPMEFTSTKFHYQLSVTKKGDEWDILIETLDQSDPKKINLYIYDNGYASMQINSSNRTPISFNGHIELSAVN